MPDRRTLRLSALDLDARVTLWNRAYEGYVVPAHFDAALLERMRALGDLRDEHSPVLTEDGEPVAFGALGLRGARAWLGGFGVVSSHRRRGLGTLALAEWFAAVRACGAHSAQLEVLEANMAAHALYVAHGFRHTRWLEVWSLPAPADIETPARVERASAEVAREALEHLPGPRDPWQREDASVRNLGDAVVGLVCGDPADPDGGASVVPGPGRVGVMRLRARSGPGQSERLRDLLQATLALAPGGTLRWINVDPADPASAVLREMGATLDVRQHEMARDV